MTNTVGGVTASDIQQLKDRHTAAQKAAAVARARNEQAYERLAEIKSQLSEEFGVETIEEAEALLAQFEAKLITLADDVDGKLRACGF